MSYFARNGKNANSAVLVNVTPEDFKDSKNPLSGIDFQKDLEEKAFVLGGSNYFAPIQRFEDFDKNIKSTFIGTVEPSYKPGVTLSNLNDILSYTTYYTSTYNDTKYYVPVTKYINSKDSDVVKIIIKELGSSPIYQTNLMSYLNANTVLNDYELDNNKLKLNFNELLLNDLDKKNILEEVIYTISLSMNNVYDNLESVSFLVNNEEIYTININDIK